ncbi:hypothetical protein [Spongiactinospora sp. 9N601]|uniref:hypothetical protein n=1 Tax=Spongiactinospora sp. 9N601 TaxID=3375149 RepID=UPI0037AEB291
MTRSRGTEIRALARDLTAATGTEVTATWDKNTWRMEWSNGPTTPAMRAAAGPAGQDGALQWDRVIQSDAAAVQAVRAALAGRRATPTGIDIACEDTDHPERPADEREARLAARLLDAAGGPGAGTAALAGLLTTRGLAPLVEPDLAPARPGDAAWAACVLTARYATGADADAWRMHLRTLPAAAAVAAAGTGQHTADSNGVGDGVGDGTAVLAALTLAPAARAELEARLAELDAIEAALIQAAREAGADWRTIGQALRITTKQGAQQRAMRLSRRSKMGDQVT